MLLMFHSLMCGSGYCSYAGVPCDNIGLVLVCLPSGSTDVAAAPSQYMIQPSGIPILSPVLFMHVGDPYIPKFEEFTCLVSFFSFIQAVRIYPIIIPNQLFCPFSTLIVVLQ